MENYNKALLIGGLGLGVVGGVAYLLSSIFSSKAEQQVGVSREDALKMIKEYKRATLRVFVKSVEFVSRLKMKTNLSQEISTEEIQGIAVQEVLKELQDERQYVANKFNITLQQFEDTFSDQYQNDQEIQQVCSWIQESFENAIKGVAPSLEVKDEVMEKFPEEKVIEMQKKILKTQSKSFNRVFKEIKEETESEQVDPSSELFKRKIRELDVHKIKTGLLREDGFEFEPESPCETFEKLSFKYKKTSPVYLQKLSQVMEIYNKIKSDIIYSEVDDSYIELIFK